MGGQPPFSFSIPAPSLSNGDGATTLTFGIKIMKPQHKSFLYVFVFYCGAIALMGNFHTLLTQYPTQLLWLLSVSVVSSVSGLFWVRYKNHKRGWRVGSEVRTQIYYDEMRDGRWHRIHLDYEIPDKNSHHTIFFSSTRFPSWANPKRQLIVDRIKNEYAPKGYEFEETEQGSSPNAR